MNPAAPSSPESRIGATSPSDPAPEVPEAAREAFDAGTRAFSDRRYEDALERYRTVVERCREARRAPAGDDDRGPASSLEVEALAMVARAYSLRPDLVEGARWLERAEALADPSEPLGWSRVRLVRGLYQRELGAVEPARATFEDLYHYCHAKGLPLRAVDAAHHVALVSTPSVQVEWARRGLDEAEALGDERWQAVLWNNLGYTYERLGDPEAVLDAYRRARTFHYRTGGELQKLIADWAVGHGERLNGLDREAAITLVDVLARAEARVLEASDAGRRDEVGLQWVAWTCGELAELAMGRGDAGAARAFLERALLAHEDPALLERLESLPERP